ncbi:MAG TPA: hypothetical protein VLT86_07485 [Vicinamibacterales bacterium]|nr:hypothetical protein [Vicinamibacterales bacterium]
MPDGLPTRDVVRQSVIEALARRRARQAARQLVRGVPWVALGVLVVAAVARLLKWPPVIPWATLGMAAVGVLGWWFVSRRRLAPTDAIAAAVDADAGLGGELRSAFWFAGETEAGEWAAFHLDVAASRLKVVRWEEFYPPVRAPRAWILAAVLVLAAVVLTVRLPAARQAALAEARRAATSGQPTLEAALPPEIRKRLEDLLAAIEKGKIAEAQANAKLQELRDLLSKIDPTLSPELAKLAKLAEQASVAERGKDDAKSLAERAEAAANSDLPAELREQLKDIAQRLANPRVGERQGESSQAAASSDAGQLGKASQSAEASQANAAQAALQLMHEAANDPASAQMMLAGAGSMGGDSRAGAGGNSGAKSGNADATQIAQALRKELIEASADTPGTNVSTEDIRRKTEHSTSALGFTHVAAPSAVDRSRTLPPPPLPDARKPLVMQYFIRRQ